MNACKSEMFLSSECVRASRTSLFPNPTRVVDVWCTLALRAVETEIALCCGEAAGRQAGNLHSQMLLEWHARIIETMGRAGVGLRRAIQGMGGSMSPLLNCCSGERWSFSPDLPPSFHVPRISYLNKSAAKP